MHDAVFHAREVPDNGSRDFRFQIPHILCDVLIEYAKLDNPDAILVLNIKDNKFSWNVLGEGWLKQTSNSEAAKQYIA